MTSLLREQTLVDAGWLNQHLGDPDLIVFDGSWHMPASGRDGRGEWAKQRIPGAAFFDFDGRICRQDSALPHMMPDADLFTREMRLLGLNQHSAVVIYDSLGMFSCARVWWMLRAMGFDNCALLDGGLPAWIAAGYNIENGDPPLPLAGDFIANYRPELLCDAESVLMALNQSTDSVLDARSAERFRGEVDEPRAGLRRGHMPGAINLPFQDLFDDGLLKSKPELKSIFARLIDDDENIICSCGSGITACIIGFGAFQAGYQKVSVYDGSWCEWGLPGDLPVVQGQHC